MPKSKKQKFSTLNKGEWSEIYAFLKLCTERYIVLADYNLIPTDKGFKILQVVFGGTDFLYDLKDPSFVNILDQKNNQIIDSIDNCEIQSELQNIFHEIIGATGASFHLHTLDLCLSKLQCSKIKASSGVKVDIKLLVQEDLGIKEFLSGFSIKSKLGRPSTLLNASKSTNFKYIVEKFNGSIDNINSIQSKQKIRDRLAEVYRKSMLIRFDEINDRVFTTNLKKIDTNLPHILAEMLIVFYSGICTSISDVVRIISTKDLIVKLGLDYEGLKHIITKFLLSVTLGMFPNKEWDGFYEAQGCIILKKSGDLVCLHILDMRNLAEYLYSNTKFETPSSSRNGFGVIYEDKNLHRFDLNLQIRFID